MKWIVVLARLIQNIFRSSMSIARVELLFRSVFCFGCSHGMSLNCFTAMLNVIVLSQWFQLGLKHSTHRQP